MQTMPTGSCLNNCFPGGDAVVEVVDPLRGRTSSLEKVGYQGQWPNELMTGSSSCPSCLLFPDAQRVEEATPQVPAASDRNQAGFSLHAFSALIGYNPPTVGYKKFFLL